MKDLFFSLRQRRECGKKGATRTRDVHDSGVVATLGELGVVVALLEGKTQDRVVVADEFEFWLAVRRVKHHVGLGGLASAVFAIVELSKSKGVF